ncbi:hypothetical protein Ciccas_005270 [Cichlidogyrus casuarinus]|uniref:E3 ubiquitin-protein ligase n=1 Tax=Cichlidogyrus casuarinus TaxID=1844966 RepID=A0ABD2QCQ6_9PLAT
MHLLRIIRKLSSDEKEECSALMHRPERKIVRRHLTSISGGEELFSADQDELSSGLSLDLLQEDDFVSRKLTRKIITQMEDALAVATGALPDWTVKTCQRLPALYPLNIRVQLFRALASGTARAVTWLQSHPPSHNTAPNFTLPAANLSGLPSAIQTVLNSSQGTASVHQIFGQIDPPNETLATSSKGMALSQLLHPEHLTMDTSTGSPVKDGLGSSALTMVLHSINSAIRSVEPGRSGTADKPERPSHAFLQALKSFADVNKLLDNPIALSRLVSSENDSKENH